MTPHPPRDKNVARNDKRGEINVSSTIYRNGWLNERIILEFTWTNKLPVGWLHCHYLNADAALIDMYMRER